MNQNISEYDQNMPVENQALQGIAVLGLIILFWASWLPRWLALLHMTKKGNNCLNDLKALVWGIAKISCKTYVEYILCDEDEVRTT